MRNRWHVNASRRHIRRNDNLNSTLEQHPDDSVAGMLRKITVQGSHRVTCIPQSTGLILGRQLGRHENDRLLHAGGREDCIEQTILVVEIIGVMDHLGQQGAIDTLGQFDPLGVLRQPSGHWSNAPIERGRKQQGLTVGWQPRGNEVDVFDKTHIEHAVGFIQNQRRDAGQIDPSPLHVIEHATWGCDHQFRAFGQRIQLGAERCTADQAGGPQSTTRRP